MNHRYGLNPVILVRGRDANAELMPVFTIEFFDSSAFHAEGLGEGETEQSNEMENYRKKEQVHANLQFNLQLNRRWVLAKKCGLRLPGRIHFKYPVLNSFPKRVEKDLMPAALYQCLHLIPIEEESLTADATTHPNS
jgi:hypothetical protein